MKNVVMSERWQDSVFYFIGLGYQKVVFVNIWFVP